MLGGGSPTAGRPRENALRSDELVLAQHVLERRVTDLLQIVPDLHGRQLDVDDAAQVHRRADDDHVGAGGGDGLSARQSFTSPLIRPTRPCSVW
jgi:hypothetical protein